VFPLLVQLFLKPKTNAIAATLIIIKVVVDIRAILKLITTFYNYENRALIPASFRPKLKTTNCDELAVNTSRPIFIVGVGKTSFL
jgi:hypothetical protein